MGTDIEHMSNNELTMNRVDGMVASEHEDARGSLALVVTIFIVTIIPAAIALVATMTAFLLGID